MHKNMKYPVPEVLRGGYLKYPQEYEDIWALYWDFVRGHSTKCPLTDAQMFVNDLIIRGVADSIAVSKEAHVLLCDTKALRNLMQKSINAEMAKNKR